MGGEGNEYVFFTRSQSQENCSKTGKVVCQEGWHLCCHQLREDLEEEEEGFQW